MNTGRRHIPSRLSQYVRISYGPPLDEVLRGLDAIEQLISDHSTTSHRTEQSVQPTVS